MTRKSLKKGKEHESVWYRYFTKERADGSWRKQLIELATKDNIKEIYITAECLVAPLLKDECWNKAEECRINLRNDYNHICIRADETIFSKEIRPLYRHYTYVRLLCGHKEDMKKQKSYNNCYKR